MASGTPRPARTLTGTSRADAVTLRQTAQRLRGVYHDANAQHLASVQLESLARLLPLRDAARKGRREAALLAVTIGAGLLALLPVALATAGSAWHVRRSSSRTVPVALPWWSRLKARLNSFGRSAQTVRRQSL